MIDVIFLVMLASLALGVFMGKEYGQWKTIRHLERDWKVKLDPKKQPGDDSMCPKTTKPT